MGDLVKDQFAPDRTRPEDRDAHEEALMVFKTIRAFPEAWIEVIDLLRKSQVGQACSLTDTGKHRLWQVALCLRHWLPYEYLCKRSNAPLSGIWFSLQARFIAQGSSPVPHRYERPAHRGDAHDGKEREDRALNGRPFYL